MEEAEPSNQASRGGEELLLLLLSKVARSNRESVEWARASVGAGVGAAWLEQACARRGWPLEAGQAIGVRRHSARPPLGVRAASALGRTSAWRARGVGWSTGGVRAGSVSARRWLAACASARR
ncbi:hypothetical protein GUJ93_ZPchr0013g37020 [Zizania palustris]|uniref:Uncharacterized protein n=1 Tax=Zizania palustris TaxID=103762 RepID=A0A8J5WYV9_ZIZPA|nr:hypothetical protein GUJ93_ZPchr0013g37020 [Zizania palustris]